MDQIDPYFDPRIKVDQIMDQSHNSFLKMAEYVSRQRRLRFLNSIPFDRRVFRDRSNPLENFSSEEIRVRYRFFPQTILRIVNLVDLGRATKRSHALPSLLTVLVSLQFLASNAHHIVIAQLHGISRVSVSRAVKTFCQALCNLLDQYVDFPRGDMLRNTQKRFYAIAGFPDVIGAIDCTHIKIAGPSENEEEYVNRKGFHSINVQMICDPTFKFTNIVAKWAGSVHDARIWRESDICAKFEREEIQGTLLGDSGYPCRKYLMTPYQAPQTQAQIGNQRFNDSLCKTRVLVEQSFPCLSYGLRMKPTACLNVIGECVILHNMGFEFNDIFPRTCDDSLEIPIVSDYQGPNTGSSYRDFKANAFFN